MQQSINVPGYWSTIDWQPVFQNINVKVKCIRYTEYAVFTIEGEEKGNIDTAISLVTVFQILDLMMLSRLQQIKFTIAPNQV